MMLVCFNAWLLQCCELVFAPLHETGSMWGLSSAGRAQHWQCWGQRFDPARLHQYFYSINQRLIDPQGTTLLVLCIWGVFWPYFVPVLVLCPNHWYSSTIFELISLALFRSSWTYLCTLAKLFQPPTIRISSRSAPVFLSHVAKLWRIVLWQK